MATTPRLRFPYPEPQHVPDVPKWNGDLAIAVENSLVNVGAMAYAERGSDDQAADWATYAVLQATMPAGRLLAIGVFHTGGKDFSIRMDGNGAPITAVLDVQNAALGIYVHTLVAGMMHGGGVATIGLAGAPFAGQTLQYRHGSSISLMFLGVGG
jgi:hypothetical protein